MTTPQHSASSLSLQFPNFPEMVDLNHLSIIIQDLSLTYEVTAVATSPTYGYVQMPANQLGPRRWSMLYEEDRVQVKTVSLSSPLILILVAMGTGGAPRVLKAWADVLSARLDLRERAQALAENRALAPDRLRAAKLNNELTEQKLRRARAEADITEKARDEILDVGQGTDSGELPIDGLHRANSLTADEFALLLDEPIRRILGYGGGEIEITTEDDD
jgi:hypothetical protein